jgi:hypothetical protein
LISWHIAADGCQFTCFSGSLQHVTMLVPVQRSGLYSGDSVFSFGFLPREFRNITGQRTNPPTRSRATVIPHKTTAAIVNPQRCGRHEHQFLGRNRCYQSVDVTILLNDCFRAVSHPRFLSSNIPHAPSSKTRSIRTIRLSESLADTFAINVCCVGAPSSHLLETSKQTSSPTSTAKRQWPVGLNGNEPVMDTLTEGWLRRQSRRGRY